MSPPHRVAQHVVHVGVVYTRRATAAFQASLAVAALIAIVLVQSPVAHAQPLPWMNTALAPEARAALLVGAMSLAQKQQQLVGNAPEIVPELPQCMGARHVRGIAALGIPTLRITNGPVGIGQNDCVDPSVSGFGAFPHPSSAKATALPSATSVAASFNPAVAGIFGDVIATEANNLALHVFEAPGVNLARLPILGRNFEYFGEDPYLTGRMAVAEIKAVQSKGIIAMAKHFAANDQETNRTNALQTTVDRRVLRELYLLPFEMSVKDGDVAAVMCAYNFLNGFQACENKELLTDILRNQWGYKGYVQSDFFAVRSTAPAMLAGLDHYMPVPAPIPAPPAPWTPAELDAALTAGRLQVSDLDRALLRRYTQMFRLGIFERQPLRQTPIDFAAGGAKARAIGVQGGVLLQNDTGALPFDATVLRSVVVIGKATQVYAQQAVAGGVLVGQPMGAGGGSSDVVPNYTVSPVDGVKNALRAQGNTSAIVTLVTVKDDNSDLAAAQAAAAAADAVIIMAGTIAEEGADRASFTDSTGLTLTALGDGLDWYVARPNATSTATANSPANSNTVAMIRGILGTTSTIGRSPMAAKTALVLKDNAGVAIDPALLGATGPAILEAWFPGQEDGNIVADLLFGAVNPSGRLPVTFPKIGHGFLDWAKTDPSVFPGVRNAAGQPEVTYKEGLNIGYRWYDAKGIAPAFPFGHGLSYTTFGYSNLYVTPGGAGNHPVTVSLTLRNTGDRAGADVPQIYASFESSYGEPPKRLVGFDKLTLGVGEQRQVAITIDPNATNHPLSFWHSASQSWRLMRGNVTLHLGRSAGDIVDSVKIKLGIPEQETPVFEFYNTISDRFFYTADAAEAAQVDGGGSGPGWLRTGESFKSGGTQPVCRLYGSVSPGPNSHLYTVSDSECKSLQQIAANTPPTLRRWNFESIDFYSTPPDSNGRCPAGTEPVYRAYNNGFAREVDSNHRLSTNFASIEVLVDRGWINEGVQMCSPQ
jgi:beta-glucosidase